MESVLAQTYPVAGIIVCNDYQRRGSTVNRNTAMMQVATPWMANLDDDDEFMPHHLEVLVAKQLETDADVVYSLPKKMQDGKEVPWHPGAGGTEEFNPTALRYSNYINTASLVRTTAAKAVGGFEFKTDGRGDTNNDFGFYLKLLDNGYKFAHVHEFTFIIHLHDQHTAGRVV